MKYLKNAERNTSKIPNEMLQKYRMNYLKYPTMVAEEPIGWNS